MTEIYKPVFAYQYKFLSGDAYTVEQAMSRLGNKGYNCTKFEILDDKIIVLMSRVKEISKYGVWEDEPNGIEI